MRRACGDAARGNDSPLRSRFCGEGDALQAVALMQQGDVVDLSATRMPMADAIILTAARAIGATRWTEGSRFEGMADIEYVSAGSA